MNRVSVYFLWLAALLLMTAGSGPGVVNDVQAQGVEQNSTPPEPPGSASDARPKGIQPEMIGESTARDSLLREIENYSEAITGLRDSLQLDHMGFQLNEQQRLRVEKTIEDLTQIIEGIGGELSTMELEITNNRISLLDEQGEGIVIDIPENLDEQLQQGFELLQQVILSELPESKTEEMRKAWSWGTGSGESQEPERTILRGNIFKVGDNLLITSNEDVRGDVVLVFGDGEISGRVDGDVITIFGNLRLGEDAEITGEVVSIGGWLDQDRSAEVGDVVVVDPFPGLHGGGHSLIAPQGILGLLMGLGEFLLVLMLTILVMAIAPRAKLDRVLSVLVTRPLPCLGVGLFGALTVALLGLVLVGVLVVTVIGIPVALLVLVAVLLLSVLSIGLVGLVLGRRLCSWMSGSCGSDWLTLLLGLFLLNSVSLLGQFAGLFPALGSVANAVVVVGAGVKLTAYWFGMGALFLGRFGRG